MVLKSLLLQGFKSFPDKTEIRFADGMTAIVGPNGSGKSNISDAIRWVLGEQSSRSLRGAKMEDVIFGGTLKRGPVGFAEVSLILDNTESIFRSAFSEIMVTRRYYRSGESEYCLNKKTCRLKDIHELFMDTGLGRDGYSIIGQGRIDEILSLKSEDRREIFEEAAGITKFRYRKEEAERKLAATEENLSRIRDIYAELEHQKIPLEQQAEKAKRYLHIRDELRVLEISLWLLSLARIETDTTQNGKDSTIAQQQLLDVRAQQDALFIQSEQLSASIRQMDQDAEALRLSLREIEQTQASHASRCAVLHANITNSEENIARIRRESDRQTEQAQALETQLDERRARCQALDAAHDALLLQQTQCTAQTHALASQSTALQQELTQKRTAREGQIEQSHHLALARTQAQSSLDNMDSRRDVIAEETDAAQARVTAEEQTQQALEAQLAQCLDTLSGFQNKLAGVSLKAETRRGKVRTLEQEVSKCTAMHTDCENRIGMLTEMQKDYEGFSRSVKQIMTASERGTLQGIHSPVSALLDVSNEYVLAIETALGAAASNIVVDTATAGRNAIAYLKRMDGGRATFLPIDTIAPHTLRENALANMSGFCGVADTLVSSQPNYRNIISNLLGRTVIVEDMDAALAMSKACSNRFRIVTKDGQMIQAGGAMTGGSASKSTGVLARANKLHELEQSKGVLAQQLHDATEQLTLAKRELAALDFDVKAIESERARAQEDEARFTALTQQHRALLESLSGQHAALVLERDNLAQARVHYETVLTENAQHAQTIATQLQALDDALAQLTAQLQACAQQQTAQNAKAAQLATSIAENRTEASAERRALADMQALKADMEHSLFGSTDTITHLTSEIATLQQELLQAQAQHEQDGVRAQEMQRDITLVTDKRLQTEGQKTAVDKKAHAQSETILQLERENARLENKSIQLENEQAHILNKMWESYELTPTPAAAIAQPIEDIPQAQRDASALKERMRALGHVNLDAVEEYAQLLERYLFLGEQKTDLENAQTELYKMIEQLTLHMKEVFAAEFTKLNTHFGETFREIFGGGQAKLELEDSGDILNCGIEIHVSPPGKALKTITLLSGGEKAFVAVALYFAILKVRPTPFCVLDEIEAALDDVNVARFAKYIRRLSDKTQFIIITHRRGTMEESDMLYGVTMQDQGISKLLLLNMVEAEQRLGIAIR